MEAVGPKRIKYCCQLLLQHLNSGQGYFHVPFCSCPLVNISEMDSAVVHSLFDIDPGVTCPLRAGIETFKSVGFNMD